MDNDTGFRLRPLEPRRGKSQRLNINASEFKPIRAYPSPPPPRPYPREMLPFEDPYYRVKMHRRNSYYDAPPFPPRHYREAFPAPNRYGPPPMHSLDFHRLPPRSHRIPRLGPMPPPRVNIAPKMYGSDRPRSSQRNGGYKKSGTFLPSRKHEKNQGRGYKSKQNKIDIVFANLLESYVENSAFVSEVTRGKTTVRVHAKTFDGLNCIDKALHQIDENEDIAVEEIGFHVSMKNRFQKKGILVYIRVGSEEQAEECFTIFSSFYNYLKDHAIALSQAAYEEKLNTEVAVLDGDAERDASTWEELYQVENAETLGLMQGITDDLQTLQVNKPKNDLPSADEIQNKPSLVKSSTDSKISVTQEKNCHKLSDAAISAKVEEINT